MHFRPCKVDGLCWIETLPHEHLINERFSQAEAYPSDVQAVMLKCEPHAADVLLGTYQWRINMRAIHTPGAQRVALFMHGHGSNCNFALWAHLWPALIDAGFHLLAFDSPGFGRSSGTTAQTLKWKPFDQDLVLRVLDGFGIPPDSGSVTVFGQCMGGAMFLRAFCARPKMFSAYHVLHNCTIGTWPEQLQGLLRAKGGGLLSFWEADDDHMRESNVYKKFTQLQEQSPELCTFIDLQSHTPGFLSSSGAVCPGATRATLDDQIGTGSCVYTLEPSSTCLGEMVRFVLNEPRVTAVSSVPQGTALQRGVPNKSFRVFVRARPFLPRETDMQSCLDISQLEDWDPPPKWDGPPPDKVTVQQDRDFVFDRVFRPEATQAEVYDAVGKPLVDSVLGGHSACLFAYGQTGSGKTYNMEGQSDPGVMMRCIQDLCNSIDPSFRMRTTYVQLYNDSLLDLFAPSQGALDVADSDEGACVVGAKSLVSRCPEEILQAVCKGAAYRASGATNMNDASSRSHAILSIHIEPDTCHQSETETQNGNALKVAPKAKGKGAAKPKAKQTAKKSAAQVFHLIDLAGSERVKRSGATGSRFDEAVSINSALLHLGNVVSALVECDGAPRSHIPYRDSILTRLLQKALGGRSRTALIACVTPSADSASETLNTLTFASRATHIKNMAEDDASSNDELPAKEEEKLEANQYQPYFDENGKTRIHACGHDIECYGSWAAGSQRPLVVLLHYYGFGGGAGMWHFLFDDLVQSGARFLAPNFPGHEGTAGSSSSRPEDMTKPGGPVDILKGLLDTLGEKKAIVVGFDWGGGIAAELALAYPKRVKKVALWCMSYRDSSKLAGLAVRNKDLLFMWDKNDPNRSPKKGKEFAAVLKSKYCEYSGELLISTVKKWIQG
eukprot:gnl/MRDRNA2_/MRDRNA2_62341_c0_seq1.p1 gnl/MRDRNA2_/MRDRNA2_62341_c0~~gnl/MRDRNA2_/MRDRNA2_62341_c0_seq1.p1  ORF type:complete len:896 (-),score=146.22 gnl/MRDRNA2_/MRDRNA2_62341_c0_seq1:85-2772(-)